MSYRAGAALVLGVLLPMPAAADQDPPGRDFPKTLIFDEPGIDDEISLPTFVTAPQDGGGRATDLDVELDKRLTEKLSVQINIGYSMLRAFMTPPSRATPHRMVRSGTTAVLMSRHDGLSKDWGPVPGPLYRLETSLTGVRRHT
jgi:hypothetical protein